MKRRQFLYQFAAGSSLALGTPAFTWPGFPSSLKILILGGTNFLGPALVQAAIDAGHQVTLLNRGITNPGLFKTLPLIKADRLQGAKSYLEASRKNWDVIIDVWPEKSRLVDEATSTFKDHTGHYLFISSIAVYDNFREIGLSETSNTLPLGTDPSLWSYSEEKARAEQLVLERFSKPLVLRPGPIKGWRDPALDLLYWLVKLKRNEPILLPGSGQDPLQFIDVKAVARFAIQALEQDLKGIYNTTGPRNQPLFWKDFVEIAHTHLNSASSLQWAPEEFLKENKVRSFEDMPLWVPLSEDPGFMQISMEKSHQAGFRHIPIPNTIDDCLAWFDQHFSPDHQFGVEHGSAGLSLEKEQELLRKL